MRGLKAKTMRAIARKSGGDPKLKPIGCSYLVKTHRRYRAVPKVGGGFEPKLVERFQLLLDPHSQRGVLQRLKKTCPKGSFFGLTLAQYRGKTPRPGTENMTIRAFPTREAAEAAMAGAAQ